MNATSISILAAGAAIASALLYTTGAFEPDIPEHRQAVMNRLIDPDSAQFRNESTNSAINAYCGEVNSRNRMGGYVGWQSYVYFETTGNVTIGASTTPC